MIRFVEIEFNLAEGLKRVLQDLKAFRRPPAARHREAPKDVRPEDPKGYFMLAPVSHDRVYSFVLLNIVLLKFSAKQLVCEHESGRLRMIEFACGFERLLFCRLRLLKIPAQSQLQTLSGKCDATRIIGVMKPLQGVYLAIVCSKGSCNMFE